MVLVFCACALVLIAALLALIALGLQAGDRTGDVRVLASVPGVDVGGLGVTLSNPGRAPVIVGISIRRPRLRLRLEAGSYVSLRRAATEPLAGVVGVLAPGETGRFSVTPSARLGRRGELVVVAGQEGRLRAIHREVRLPAGEPRPAAARHGSPRLR